MPIQAQSLPPNKSVYSYPVVIPGQELSPEQVQQANLAQIAGIVLSVAAAKKALEIATTNQIVLLLRTTNLLLESGVKSFAKTAAMIMKMALQRSREITWAGVAARAQVVGIELPAVMPPETDLPPSRHTDLEKAYARIAEEYKKHLAKTKDDPIIKKLADEMVRQGLSPIPRPENLTNDVKEKKTPGEAEWQEAFRKAESRAVTFDEGVPAQERAAAEVTETDYDPRYVFVPDDPDQPEYFDWDTEPSDYVYDSPETVADFIENEFVYDSEYEALIEKYAQQKAEERAERMVSHDIAASSRDIHNVAINKMPAKTVVGYRRVVHPELSKSGHSCGLCIVASTMLYKRGDLMPIHSGCNCETVEVYMLNGEVFDPGEQINYEDLKIFYREAGDSTHGWDLKKGRYKVVDHPEYGPTLVNAKAKKTTEPVQFIERKTQ